MRNKLPVAGCFWILLAVSAVVFFLRLGIGEVFTRPVELSASPAAKDVIADPAAPARLRVAHGSSYPMITWRVALEPGRHYRACLPVFQATEATAIVVDIAGLGYDSGNQEHRFQVAKSSSLSTYCFTFDAESPPADTSLRVMFDGIDGVMNASVDVAVPRLEKLVSPSLVAALEIAQTILLALLCAFAAGWVALRRLASGAASDPGESRAGALGKVFFCVALFGLSVTPALLTFKREPPDMVKVQELRTLAPMPRQWIGHPWDIDKNFAAFDRWFNDHLA